MKRIIFVIAIVFTFNTSIAQNFEQLASYQFESEESYHSEENKVLACANYLFNNPSNKSESNRLISTQYIMKWMMGTPDYTFDLGEKEMKLTKGNSDLLGLYMAAMTKVVLENKDKKMNSTEIYDQAQEVLVNYCGDKKNKMKPSKKIKKILKSREN